jgi:hypothetical protein
MVTMLLTSGLLDADGAPPAYPTVRDKLVAFAGLLELPAHHPNPDIDKALREYRQAAARQTTNPGQRKIRQEKMVEILEKL